jgi:hypothetical protein
MAILEGDIRLRGLPYPYEAMLSICSDLDETPSAETYLRTSRFLNTKDKTPFGQGVGLEVGNTIYFYMNPGAFSYWNSSDDTRSIIRHLIRSGHVDCIHSFGDAATQRAQVQETLEHLDKHDCKIRVWIDHAVARTNFGADIMQGSGDVLGDPAYHADLTLDYGISYVWRGRVTSMRGQDAPASVRGIWQASEPVGSLVTWAKEAAKVCAAALGNAKYGLHRTNRLIRDVELRDSQRTIEFLRTNPHPLGVSTGDNACGLAMALSDEFLDRLVARRGKAIIYTHLGKQIDVQSGFPAPTRIALEKLAGRMHAGQVLVATTQRILDYAAMTSRLRWKLSHSGDMTEIALQGDPSLAKLDGLSFIVPVGRKYRVSYRGQTLPAFRVKAGGEHGEWILHMPWAQLAYGA